jgi:hypothetical protein
MFKTRRSSWILVSFWVGVLALSLLSACNMPGRSQPTDRPAGVIYTAAAETLAAQFTQVNQPQATLAPATQIALTAAALTPAPAQNTQTPGATNAPAATTAPSAATSTAVPCDAVKFVKDVTYPDDTEVASGAAFVKTWRLQNVGSCAWNSNYTIVPTGGDLLGAPSSVLITNNSVAPGETVDISVTLTAPNTAGTYRGDWKVRNAAGVQFGLDDGTKPFWVQVKVALPGGLALDFLVKAQDAVWTSGVGDNPDDTALTFGGADDDPNGVAKIKDNVTIETGAGSGKILLTFPKHAVDGGIMGLYPAYTVQTGDHFKARLGFMLTGTTCGTGKVVYQLKFKEDGTIKDFKQWQKSCDGNFLVIDQDLSSLRGRTVQFVLIVRALESPSEDWAIWNSPQIFR